MKKLFSSHQNQNNYPNQSEQTKAFQLTNQISKKKHVTGDKRVKRPPASNYNIDSELVLDQSFFGLLSKWREVFQLVT